MRRAILAIAMAISFSAGATNAHSEAGKLCQSGREYACKLLTDYCEQGSSMLA